MPDYVHLAGRPTALTGRPARILLGPNISRARAQGPDPSCELPASPEEVLRATRTALLAGDDTPNCATRTAARRTNVVSSNFSVCNQLGPVCRFSDGCRSPRGDY